ncbi:TadE/TadG family type IV pilus assembly protein [Pedococcus sp. P5_B7]
MALKRPIRSGRPEGGAAAVEFALVMPILVLLISSIVGFGVVLAQQMALGNAARQTARNAVVDLAYCGTGGGTGNAGTSLIQEAKLNSNTLFVTTNNVRVEIKKGTTTPANVFATDWTGTCTGDSGVTSRVCNLSSTGDNAYVRVRYTSTLSLPFFQPSFNLSSIGAFRCETQ